MGLDLTATSRLFIDVLAVVGPIACAATAAFVVHLSSTSRGRTLLRLAHRGFQAQKGGRWREWVAGTMLPLLAVAALTTALGIEAEIRTGPNRMIDAVEETAPEVPGASSFWVLQRGTQHLMNSSRVDADVVDPAAPGIEVTEPFWVELVGIERAEGGTQTGLLLSGPEEGGVVVSPPVRTGAICSSSGGRCELRSDEVVVDSTDGYAIGETITVRGREARVVGSFEEPMSLLNRSVIFGWHPADAQPFGLVATARDRDAIRGALVVPPQRVEVLTTAELRDANAGFWSGNGTPILTMLVVLVATFSAAAIYATRRAENEATSEVRRTIRALGLTRGEGREADLARGLLAVLVPALPAIAVAGGLLSGLNAAVLGFHAGVAPGTALAALGTTLIAAAAAAAVSAGRRGTRRRVARSAS